MKFIKCLQTGTAYKFHTYNPVGRSVVIKLYAKTEEAAWAHFRSVYGDALVDMVAV